MVGASFLLITCLGPWLAVAQRQQQGQEPPKWMSDEAKDLFNDLMGSEAPFSEATCETREGLLKALTGNGAREAGQYRYLVLKEIGVCEFNKGNFVNAKKRLDSAVSELNLPNDDMMLTNQDLAPTGLMRQAAEFMKKYELTQAATAMRRSREISDRNLKKVLKFVHKQIAGQQGGQNVPPVEKLIEEIPGFGKTGQFLPMLMKQAPILKQELPFAEQIDRAVEDLDKKLATYAPQQKTIRRNLDTSKGSKAGTLMYVRGLVTEDVVPGDRLMAATDLTETGAAKAFKEEAASVDKSMTLLKRTTEGKGCKEENGLAKTCAALAKIPDLKSNGFGETRVLALKPDKKQQLDSCTTNANVGILLAAQDGVTAKAGATEKALTPGLPVVVDFCQEVSLTSSKQAVVLFAQAWHPEFAAVERTTELRARSKAFSLSEDEVKEATKIVNDNAKKNWEKSAKQWRSESPLIENIKETLKAAKDSEAKAAEEAAEAKRKEMEAGDEERKKNLEALEAKRAAKKKREQEAEEKRKARKKQLDDEKANRDPWLNDPTVVEAQEKLDSLKEARRDANAKLEFDLTSSLTKEISAQERLLKKVTKAARKAFKKGGGQASAKAEPEAEKKAESGPGDKAADIKKELAKVKKEKEQAAEAENFKEAKRLKGVQKDLEDQLKKLEL